MSNAKPFQGRLGFDANNNKIINVAAPTALGDVVNYETMTVPAHTSTRAYPVGFVVEYNNQLHKSKTALVAKAFNQSDWTIVADGVLRTDLATSNDVAKGAGLIGYYGITLQQAMSRSRSIRTFGAVGNGADDTSAINAAEVWLATSTIDMPLHLIIDIPVRYTQKNKLGAITLIGVSGFTIECRGSGKLLMDNLNAGLGTGGGIFASGPAKDITTINLNVEWVTKPSTRSTGDGFMFKGYPSDANCIDNLKMLGRTQTKWSPQTGGIILGCKDPFIESFIGIETLADNLHFNACQRPVVLHNYSVTAGDDTLGLVTYYHESDVGGGGLSWKTSRSPYNQPTLGDWNNTGCYIGGITANSNNANAIRLAGVNGATIGPIRSTGTVRGMMCDAGIADGSSYKWSYVASKKIRIESVTANGCAIGSFFQVYNRSLVLAHATPELFTDCDVSIGNVTTRASVQYGFYNNGMNGVNIDCIDTEGSSIGVLLQRTNNACIGKILGTDIVTIDHACSNIYIGDTECSRVNINLGEGPSSNISFGRITCNGSSNNAVYVSRVVGLYIISILAKNFNTSGGVTNNSALNIQACTSVHIGSVTAESTDVNARLLEIGGGTTSILRSNDIRIDSIHARLSREDAGITIQGGGFGPLNFKYAGKWRNSSTGAWNLVTADTYA